MENEAFADLVMGGGGVLLSLLSVAGAYLVALVRQKLKSELAAGVMKRLGFAARAAVKAVYQEYVQALKESNADGKLTDAEMAEAKARAIAKAKGLLNLGELIKLFSLPKDGVDHFIGEAIETAIGEVRSEVVKPSSNGSGPRILNAPVNP